jgi:tripartite-type tricarboxylate transporter receptor subunit TctC
MAEGRARGRTGAGVSARAAGAADGEAFPSGPIRLIVGFSQGSASDTLATAVAPELARVLGQTVTIERHAGADGVLAARALIASAADGHTLLVATLGSHALNPSLVPDLPYHPLKDFTPIALLMRAPLVLGTYPGLRVASVAALIARARQNPGGLSFGCSALAGAPRLAAELFCRSTNVRARAAVYGETEELYADLVVGRIDFTFNNPMTMLPRIASGQVTGLAVTGRERCSAAPNLPTMPESGLAGFEVTNWVGIVGPAGLPPERAAHLNAAVRAALASPTLSDRLVRLGVAIPSDTPDKFAAHIARELARWTPVLQAMKANQNP